MAARSRQRLSTRRAALLAAREPRRQMRRHRIMRCAGDELTDRPVCAYWPGVRRAGLMRVNGSVVLGQARILVAAGG